MSKSSVWCSEHLSDRLLAQSDSLKLKSTITERNLQVLQNFEVTIGRPVKYSYSYFPVIRGWYVDKQ